MILKESKLRCVDNSGARVVRCINFLKGTGGGYIGVGAIIKVAIQRYRDRRKLGGGEEERKPMLNLKATYFALVVSVRRNTRRFGNFFFKAGANRVILIKKKKK